MKKIAIIDIGTNTFHLLIVEISNDSFKEIYRQRIFVNLAENGIQKISEKAFQRGQNAIQTFHKQLIGENIESINIFGTAALRTASNAQDFKKEVFDNTGLTINIIDGQREADLILKGTKLAIDINTGRYMIMDIGGGSVEFICTENGKVAFQESFPIGVAVLFDKFHNSEPISKQDLSLLESYVSTMLEPLRRQCKDNKITALIGASGSFEVVEQILHSKGIVEDRISREDFLYVYHDIISSNLQEREQYPGLPKQRAKLIIAAFVLIKYALDTFDIKWIQVSPYAMKEGAISELF